MKNLIISNALSSIREKHRFPQNVFVNKWDNYLFFESDAVFRPEFIDAKNLLIDEEGSSEIVVLNLGNTSSGIEVDDQAIVLRRSTNFPEYFLQLKGDGSPNSWLFLMDRYVCASDKRNWVIYCERENDIAVIALREISPSSIIPKLRAILKAEPIEALDARPSDSLFAFDKLVPNWRTSLKAGYGI